MLINFFEKQQNSKICKTKLYSLVENNYEDQKNKTWIIPGKNDW